MSSNKYSLTLNDNISSLSHELEGEYLSYLDIANEQDKALTPVESNELLYGMRNLLKFSELTLSDMQQSPFNEGYITAVDTYRTGFFIRHNYVEGSKQ